jgi:hypothetical protein
MEEANKRNETRKSNAVARGMKADCQPQPSVCTERINSLIVNDSLIMEK